MKETELTTPQFKKLVTDFEKALINEKKSEGFISEHTSYIKECLSYCELQGITSMSGIDQSLIDKYMKYLEQERINVRMGGTLSTGTINKQKNVIRKFWEFLGMEGIKVKPIHLRQKKYQKELPTVLTPTEIQWLYSVTDTTAIGYRDRCMLSLYYGCGLRRSEGLRLILTDIDFGKGRILIRKTKNNRERYVMMSPKVQQMVEDYVYSARDFYLPANSKHDRLFISERGKPMHSESLRSRIDALWLRVKERYKADKPYFGLHALRHSLGTHLYMAGMDVDKIALMLGHRTLEATQLYIHSSNEIKAWKNLNSI